MLRSPLRKLLILLMVIILIDFTLRIEHCYPELILFNINELTSCILVEMCSRIYSFYYTKQLGIRCTQSHVNPCWKGNLVSLDGPLQQTWAEGQ